MKLLSKEMFASEIRQYVHHDNYDAIEIAQYAFLCYSDYIITDEKLKEVVYEIMMMDAGKSSVSCPLKPSDSAPLC